MDLFTLLQTLDRDAAPDRCKLHLAVWNGRFDPLDAYLEGGFDEWQSLQRRRNFGLDFIVSQRHSNVFPVVSSASPGT